MRGRFLALASLPFAGAWAQPAEPAPDLGTAKGVVFEDRNRNGKRDAGELGLPDVWVSNQRTFAKTDAQGRWQLPYNDDTLFYVVKPRNYMTPVDDHQKPQFFYIHKPKGSPPNLQYPGVKPTGPLPASIDFPLYRRPEPKTFKALFFGDTQPRDVREVDYLTRDIFEPLMGKAKGEYDFGVTLGDVVFDDLDVFAPLTGAIGLIGIPWYYVLGNHDINFDVPHDGHSHETWHRHFGPNYYSFTHGPVHFVVLDNVIWVGAENAKKEDANRQRGYYYAGLGKTQLEWLRQDLAKLPDNQLTVFMMHIPMTEIREQKEFYELVASRPYALSVSAHTHMQEHRFIKQTDGWPKAEPHHHVINVTTCGSWWTGAPDIRGVPHTTMRDGAPHGYSVFSFDGTDYKIEFRAARRPADYQMNIHVPDTLRMGAIDQEFHVNVFGGSERSRVEFKFGNGPWSPMNRTIAPDPWYMLLAERDKNLARPYRSLSGPANSTHLWKGQLRGFQGPGVIPLHVRTTDMFGQTYTTTRAIRVL